MTVSYLGKIWAGIRTTAVGMKLTGRHFFQKKVTIQFPEGEYLKGLVVMRK